MKLERKSSEAGFTMVEILTALTIMGLMTSVVVLTLPSSDTAFRGEVRQLAARLEMAAQESIIGGRPLGFAISGEGYAFQRLQDGAWVEFDNDRIFEPHRWPEATFVALERNSFFEIEDDPNRTDEMITPMVQFDPTGLPTHYVIQLERGTSAYTVRALGRDVEVDDANL